MKLHIIIYRNTGGSAFLRHFLPEQGIVYGHEQQAGRISDG
jgi:hypothetical protein